MLTPSSCDWVSDTGAPVFPSPELPDAKPIKGSRQNAAMAQVFTQFHRKLFHSINTLPVAPVELNRERPGTITS
jgi:hypothetical protein